MSLRFKTQASLKALSKKAQAQIAATSVFPTQKATRCRINSTESGEKYCEFPSHDPGVVLHKALVKRFGSRMLDDRGEIAHEVIIAGSETRYRFDHLHIPSRCLIEFDGFGYHRTLDAFKRDRLKQTFALTEGFVVFRITNAEVRESVNTVIAKLETIIQKRLIYQDSIRPLGKTQCLVDTRNSYER